LAAFRRGANLPYFAKQGDYMAFFPQERKRAILQAFPALAQAQEGEKEPV